MNDLFCVDLDHFLHVNDCFCGESDVLPHTSVGFRDFLDLNRTHGPWIVDFSMPLTAHMTGYCVHSSVPETDTLGSDWCVVRGGESRGVSGISITEIS